MNPLFTRLTLAIVVLLQVAATVYAGPLDDYYLQQFGEVKNAQLQKAVLSLPADVQESAHCGMPLKHGLRRDWNLLEQTTQKVLAKQLALPALSSEKTFTSAAGHFNVHYAASGTDAPSLADLDNSGIPDWVETVAATFETVYAKYSTLGYRPAPTAGGAPYDLYLKNLAPQGYYGVTNSNQAIASAGYPNAFSSWMELDNNFTDSIYKPSLYSPLQSLQITAAHEYHHAIQYGYNYYFDIWYAEATSTWMEDELYDSVNQLYSYIPAWFTQSTLSLDISESISTGGGYGRWVFNRFLAEKHGLTIVRNAWERLAGIPSPGGGDISMAPVLDGLLSSPANGTSLSAVFFSFATRVYTRDWDPRTPDETDKIHAYSPVATYSVYPVNSSMASQTPLVTLPHYSFAYYKFTPAPGMHSLTITIARSSGIQSAVFRKRVGVITEIIANNGGNSYTDNSFNSADEVVLLIANTTSIYENANANFSTDGTTVTTTTPTKPVVSGSSNSCFIATAAYGSYLHPQVQLLRNFRDEYLLTNAPGRAFVAFYYRNSPPLADFIARHPFLRGVTRLALTPLVVAVSHPLLAIIFLLLMAAAVPVAWLLRINTGRLNVHSLTN